ncbi:RNA 2'-phosphotransferase [Candidatus Eisenbacteria bacterium]|uniref:Probable RNA 2'-phosphotransferase n=1 Tax=Eiseniibacteriota bacterium TaxID=2212470 RepID=A0ABV6YIU1_UNCEI
MEELLDRHEVRLSRFMALVLRHKPELVGLTLSDGGWVPLAELIDTLKQTWRKGPITREAIQRIVDLDDKRRYEIDSKSRPQRIRACYGHSTPTTMDYPETDPPAVLYHGTARRFLGRIWASGLLPMQRQYVHLSEDAETARRVGERRDPEPVILLVDAAAMARDGHTFYVTAGGMYLVEFVPAGHLRIADGGVG